MKIHFDREAKWERTALGRDVLCCPYAAVYAAVNAAVSSRFCWVRESSHSSDVLNAATSWQTVHTAHRVKDCQSSCRRCPPPSQASVIHHIYPWVLFGVSINWLMGVLFLSRCGGYWLKFLPWLCIMVICRYGFVSRKHPLFTNSPQMLLLLFFCSHFSSCRTFFTFSYSGKLLPMMCAWRWHKEVILKERIVDHGGYIMYDSSGTLKS